MKNYLILNITSSQLQVQVNKRDSDGMCYNLLFEKCDGYLACHGFMSPTFSGNYYIPITGNSESRTMQHCLKILPKLMENKTDVLEFLSDLIKKEKLNHYQVNINGNMSYENAEAITWHTLANVLFCLDEEGIPRRF
jgi:hypothetical protein